MNKKNQALLTLFKLDKELSVHTENLCNHFSLCTPACAKSTFFPRSQGKQTKCTKERKEIEEKEDMAPSWQST